MRHLFVLGTTAPPGKELRVTGNGAALAERRRAEWQQVYGPLARSKWATARVERAGLGGVRRSATSRPSSSR